MMNSVKLFEVALATVSRGRPIDVVGGLAQFRMAQRIVRARRAAEWRKLVALCARKASWRAWR